jgi:hypothetical protein
VNVDGDPDVDDGLPHEEPVDDEVPAEEIPLVVMAAMRDRMHSRRLSSADDNGHVQESLGSADDDVHVVDDGPEHCMIGRPVGSAPDGSVYVLVARITRYGYEQLRDGDVEMARAFSDGRDLSLCAVYEVDGTVENIALVRRYRHGDDVPAEYLPPSPFLEFADEDSPTDDFSAETFGLSESEPSASVPSESVAEGPVAEASAAEGSAAEGSVADEGAPVGDHLPIDEDALIDEPARGGRLRRGLGAVTGGARRRQRTKR